MSIRPISARPAGEPEGHEQLAATLRATPATVILSGYPSPLYDNLYADWWHIDVPVSVHSSNAVTVDRARRVERIWSNRDLMVGRFDLFAIEAP
jgi:DNA adenine methylase